MKVTLLHTHKNEPKNIEPLIKQVAHISYNKDGDTSEEAASRFIQKHVLNGGHHSLLRHAWFTLRTTPRELEKWYNYFKLPNHIRQYMVFNGDGRNFKVSGTLNMWWSLFNHLKGKIVPLVLRKTSPTLFGENTALDSSYSCDREDYAHTFLIEDCSRLFTHQQVRHTHNFAYNQESTRYVSYCDGFDFVMPEKLKGKVDNYGCDIENVALDKLEQDKEFYNYLVKNGVKKEDARYFLPNGITSKIAITVHHESLFGQYKYARAEGKTGKPSSEIQAVAREMIRLVEENEH